MPTHKISEKRDFGPVLFFARYPKSKMNSRIVMPTQKEKHEIKKFFSRNTPPGLLLSE